MSLFSKNDAVRLNRPNMMLGIRPLEIEGETDSFPNARILEGFAARVEVPALNG